MGKLDGQNWNLIEVMLFSLTKTAKYVFEECNKPTDKNHPQTKFCSTKSGNTFKKRTKLSKKS